MTGLSQSGYYYMTGLSQSGVYYMTGLSQSGYYYMTGLSHKRRRSKKQRKKSIYMCGCRVLYVIMEIITPGD